ncbi:9526_t:CDS:2, partial [Dentiscutata erythropus]
NGYGFKSPPMGWNPYNFFTFAYNETIIKQQADIIATIGYLDVGFRYINLDLAEYIHSKGLLFGIYSDAGNETCGGLPDHLYIIDHKEIDAKIFVEWGVDYLKYDNCFSQGRPEQERYQKMGKALKDATKGTNKTIFYSICEWEQSDPWLWEPDIGN